jgi:hypothetical protein
LPFPPPPSRLSATESAAPASSPPAPAITDRPSRGRRARPGSRRRARAFLEWAHDTGFTLVRVLAMNPRGWFDLPRCRRPARCHDCCRSQASSLRVQIVALANTTDRTRRFCESRFARWGACVRSHAIA